MNCKNCDSLREQRNTHAEMYKSKYLDACKELHALRAENQLLKRIADAARGVYECPNGDSDLGHALMVFDSKLPALFAALDNPDGGD